MTDLCQSVSWLILSNHFAEMEYSKSKTKQKSFVPKNLPSSTTNSKESSKYSFFFSMIMITCKVKINLKDIQLSPNYNIVYNQGKIKMLK